MRQFQTFKAVADLNSFTKAAQQLQYSQATITSHIQQLEEELGYPLFDRLGKRIALTAVGHELYIYVGELLTAYTKIKHISDNDDTVKGELRIGASETMTVYKLGPVLSQYKKSYPDVRLSLVNDNCIPLREKLHAGELDIVITMEPIVSDAQLISRTLFEEQLVFVSGRDRAASSILAASGECMIFSEKNCSLRRTFEAYMVEKGLDVSNQMEFTSMEAMKQCIVSGLGISLMPTISVAALLGNGDMKVIELTGEPLTFYAQVSYHKDKWLSVAHKKFLSSLSKHFDY
ncbi:LysR family transcriptional regulator [Paenibacillus sp. GSMTC-2017]|uniref:LysR family transcriptional regulator n=1 Tax=Paenibacillus sp. GSMTC-2017 TaxID=2794350 RepID=UPI002FBD4FC0